MRSFPPIYAAALCLLAFPATAPGQGRYGDTPTNRDAPSTFVMPPAPTQPPAGGYAGSASQFRQPQAGAGSGVQPPAPRPVAPPSVASLPNPPSGFNQPSGSYRSAPVQPASPPVYGSQSATSAAQAAGPQAVMRAMLSRPSDSRLGGSPVTLSTVVQGAPSREEQSRRIDAYWDLCAGVADYYLGLREAQELQMLRQRVPVVSAALDGASRELLVRVGTSLAAASASQHRLAGMMGGGAAPLPGDAPFCGPYNTRYDANFPGRASAEAAQLNQLLPMRFEELRNAAEAVTRSEAWVASVATKQTANSTGAGMLRSLELLALNRRAFVQIAKDYNRRITRYTELATPGRIDNGRLVAMLIGSPQGGLSASTLSSPTGAGRLQFQPGRR